jgi:hypothetical protein
MPAAQVPIGPSFDCARAETALPQFICSDATLPRVDLELVQPYYVLRQLVGQEGWQELRYEAKDFQDQTAYDCKITDAGELPSDLPKLKTCLIAAYKAQRQAWLQKLQGAGREEASRPIEQHLRLQAKLQALGYLPPTAKIDGIYGPATRDAIAAWQTASQLPATGLLGTNDGVALSQSRLMADVPVGPPTFLEGQRDRQSWEIWFAGTVGDYRKGAIWWAGRRSLPHPGSCLTLSGDARNGCLDAKNKLDTSDIRRRSDQDYRRGWNS